MKGGGKFGCSLGVLMLGGVTFLFAGFGGDEPIVPAGAGLDARRVPAQYLPWVQKAARTCELITGPVIAAQIDAESSWQPDAKSRNPRTGEVIAEGISQFIPSTWATVGMDVASKDGRAEPDGIADPFTPGDAIMTQAKYDCGLAKGIDQRLKAGTIHGDRLALTLAAYNAGMGAVEGAHGIPSIPETQGYVRSILALIPQYSAQNGGTAPGGTAFGNRIVDAARKQIGVPYSWGGGSVNGPTLGFAQGAGTVGFDCSSLVQYAVYQASGGATMLPRTSQAQAAAGQPVQRSDMRPGDVIAFALNGGGDYDHIGIYIGNGRMIHAPRTGRDVSEEDITTGYYTGKPQVVRRFGQ